jgi:hypothetical protein
VASVPPFAIDPLLSVPFTISSSDKIATAGSCFAQHIARGLQSCGFNYYVPEQPPASLSAEEAQRRNYGVFSCRYANIYTSRQLLQLVARAYGRFKPDVDVWQRADGRFVDPFRPLVEPDGFLTVDDLHADRAVHLAAVRKMLESLDVLVFTFGQTECWRTKSDGAVVPVAPGVAGGQWPSDVFEFWNMRVADVVADFLEVTDLIRASNSKAKIVVSVSPVPLVATYENRHALVSNAYTKATLRVAVDEICAVRPEVSYFPSYEVITASCNATRYYEDDQRNVTPQGVAHAMRIFFSHFAADRGVDLAAMAAQSGLAGEVARLASIVCDEDRLDTL